MLPERFAHLDPDGLPPAARHLLEQGYCVLPEAMPAAEIEAMSRSLDDRFHHTPFCVGDFHGRRTKRFHRLLARLAGAERLVMQPDLLGLVRLALGRWCDFPEISLTQGLEVHAGAPAQIPHADQSMWPAVPKGMMELSVNVIWPFVPFTAENGATRVWPASHLRPRAADASTTEPAVCALAPGDALVLLGSTVHAAGANRSAAPRRAVIVSYCLGWLKAYENQALAYPPDVARTLSPELASMLGYRWHRPNLGTFDGQCPSVLLADGEVPEYLATIDALAPEHEALVAAHAARQADKESWGRD
ncbi:phytanoyl-CoA dioxygenase family protein [Sphingosinicella terrae]|uniref:phytanoyl-CoA dioxygenase family protein n=1 Tax=Sphingosinicella terrae TaxID=2172047 RepID=UPI000E0D702D|nr:phytanoyl-CoA dioxygenase family protein [Sphingosinicella terrae]